MPVLMQHDETRTQPAAGDAGRGHPTTAPPVRRPLLATLAKALRPSLVVPLTLGASVVAALVALSDPARVVAVMEGFQYRSLLAILALMVLYEAVRCAQWGVLLRAMGISAPLRTQVFSFLGGEVAGFLPAGTYFRNYLLGRSTGARFSLSSAATTVSLLSEVVICLVGVVILGLGAWSAWLRPLIVVGGGAFLVLVWAAHKWGHTVVAPRRLKERVVVQRAMNEAAQFRAGTAALWRPRVLAAQGILGALYLTIAGVILYVVLRGVGLGEVTPGQALGVFFFSLAAFLISPLSVGMMEVSGVTALVVVGVDEPTAVGAMLIYRVLRTGFPLALALLGLAVLHRDVRAALRERAA